MKHTIKTAVLIFILSTWTQTGWSYPTTYNPETPKPFDNLLVVGDSISDPGNLFPILSRYTLHLFKIRIAEPFYDGMVFSNEHSAADKVAQSLELGYTIPAYADINNSNSIKNQNLLLRRNQPGNNQTDIEEEQKQAAELLHTILAAPTTKPRGNLTQNLQAIPDEKQQLLIQQAQKISLPSPTKNANNFAIARAMAAEAPFSTKYSFADSLSFLVFNKFSLSHQVTSLIETRKTQNLSNTPIFMIIGSNDVMEAIQYQDRGFIKRGVKAISDQAQRLITELPSLQYLFIANVPMLGKTPRYNHPKTERRLANTYSKQFNKKLKKRIKALRKRNPQVNIVLIDLAKDLSSYLTLAKKQHLNIKSPCVSDVAMGNFNYKWEGPILDRTLMFLPEYLQDQNGKHCNSSRLKSDYVFFDDIHPTSNAYNYFGKAICQLSTTMTNSPWQCL